MSETKPRSATLLMHCPDRAGLVAQITQFIHANNGNILHLEQHVDRQENVFFMRVEWDLTDFWIPDARIGERFAPLAQALSMHWALHLDDEPQRMALLVSKQAHCLYELLGLQQAGELPVEIPLIIGNHDTLRPVAEKFGIPFHHIPVTAENKAAAEAQQLALLAAHQVNLIVLARYMQIVSADFISHFPNRIINIHHSFLPAFAGARPYHKAYERGVKLIGATSHYVTAQLDAGPIIEQDVARISHKESVRDLVRRGRDLEKTVLARAVWYHLQHKILTYNNKTVVFS